MEASKKSDQVSKAIKDDLLKLNLRQSLNLTDLIGRKDEASENGTCNLECLFCSLKFYLSDQNSYLAHLLKEHRFVISEVDLIGHFQK